MKRIVLLFAFPFTIIYGQCQNWLWVHQGTATNNQYGDVIAADGSGNILVAGRFSDSITFSGNTLASTGSGDAYFAKYDGNGNFIWIEQIGGSLYENINGIKADGAGNVYLTGSFSSAFGSTGVFDTITLTGNGSDDFFLARYNSGGAVQWAKAAGGTSSDVANGLATDAAGNCYVTGFFSGTATFGTSTLTSNGGEDIFIAKYDPDGNFLWANSAGGAGNDRGKGLSIDATGNCYVAGNFNDSILIGGQWLVGYTVVQPVDMFIAKFDASGNFIWAKKAGQKWADNVNGINCDNSGNFCITGTFTYKAKFDTITVEIGGTNETHLFIAKYDSSGSVQWAYGGGTGGVPSVQYSGNSVISDNTGNIYLTGTYSYNIQFGSLPSLPTATNLDLFVVKYDALGNAKWAQAAGDAQVDGASGITVNNSGTVFITGSFQDSCYFGATGLYSSNFQYDAFIAALSDTTFSGGAVPIAPTNLTATATGKTFLTSGKIDLTWNDNSSDEDGFRIERSPDGSSGWTVIGNTASGITFFQDTGLAASTTFYYRVYGYNISGNSGYSNIAFATTFPLGFKEIPQSGTEFNVFPNPAEEHITVSAIQNTSGLYYEITDLFGRIILTGTINSIEEKIDVTSLSNGIYLFRLQGNNHTPVKLIVL